MKTTTLKKTLLKISVSAVLILIIFLKVDKKAFWENFSQINVSFLPLIFLLVILNYIVSSIRWKKLLCVYKGCENISLWKLIKLYFEGAFFNNFLPTSIGGDFYKALKLGSHINDKSKAFASTFMERFSGVVVLILFAFYGLISTFKMWGLVLFVLFWVACFIFFKSLGFLSKKFKKVEKFTESLNMYRNSKSIIVYALFTSIFVQVFSILTQYFIFIALHYNIPLDFSFFAFPVIILASFVIPSQNSFGVQDSLYAAFFSQVGVPIEGAISASIVYHLVRLAVSLIGGVFYAIQD